MTVLLPATFVATHQTGGLAGYPAVDVFGRPGESARVGFYGRVRRISGKSPELGGRPGGAYGRSLYIRNEENGWERYLTHLDELLVELGDRVGPGELVATIADSAVSGKPGTSHVHMGLKRPA